MATFSLNKKKRMLEKTMFRCAHCGMKLNEYTMTVEHVFPRCHGGLNDEFNLLPLCQKCNYMKGNSVLPFEAFYPHVVPIFRNAFQTYFDYVSYDYNQQSVIGYDEAIFHYIPDSRLKMVYNVSKKKKLNYSQAAKIYGSKAILRKVYPASAETIFRMIQKHVADPAYRIEKTIYENEHLVLQAIEDGMVYELVTPGDEICGIFVFENVNKFCPDFKDERWDKMLQECNLTAQYIMTFVSISQIIPPAFFNLLMEFLGAVQIERGHMPLYFSVLSYIYRDASELCTVPYKNNCVEGTIEFRPLAHIKESLLVHAKEVFDYFEYKDVPEEDFDLFFITRIKTPYMHQVRASKEGRALLKKYPKLKNYFRSDPPETYNTGFSTPYAIKIVKQTKKEVHGEFVFLSKKEAEQLKNTTELPEEYMLLSLEVDEPSMIAKQNNAVV